MDRLSESDPEEEYVDISDDNSIEIIPKIENDDDTQICIEEPIIVENSYVLYPIVGKEADGKFESKRRYREFIALRENLKCQWQGCYIPQIPPKVYIVIITIGKSMKKCNRSKKEAPRKLSSKTY